MAYEKILLEIDPDGIAVVTFNRPKVLNALDAATIEELADAVGRVERDPAVRAVILTGAGDKAFVAGADIGAMSGMGPLEARRFAEAGHGVLARLEALAVPTIAAVNGYALGGGCEVAMGCDLVYASEKARFGQPEVNLGIIPGFGGTQRLTRRVGIMRALELIMTGDAVDAAKAKEIGLALEVLPAAELLPFAKAQAKKIAGKGPVAIAAAKRVVREGADADLRTASELERQAFAALFGTADAREGMRAFVEKRAARWKGA
ncbi:MAG TPA: enoyl-CoA hydratase-related protein [Anaeromyxobacteraceae bacterium]|nr:enoyl-CoA hydratase-related protein [Anaeromyxobacteraceae bacterium]